jgi:hypothetical protein
MRVFLAWDGKALNVIEVLLDNEAWAPGEKLAAARDWSGTGGAEETWGVRWFGLVVPVRTSGEAEVAQVRRVRRVRPSVAAEGGGATRTATGTGTGAGARRGDEEDDGNELFIDSNVVVDSGFGDHYGSGSGSGSESGSDSDSGSESGSDSDSDSISIFDLFRFDSDDD